uniref:Uncharacterized protein LOC113791143 n=1 Tax=Dermatophagoides pteronyssinus TaxID=6956 RepID=A0A6P6XTM6_DERPT|nr:uncharacterized protein LOC113791143 [Dermatophagoides pteronyssinus]
MCFFLVITGVILYCLFRPGVDEDEQKIQENLFFLALSVCDLFGHFKTLTSSSSSRRKKRKIIVVVAASGCKDYFITSEQQNNFVCFFSCLVLWGSSILEKLTINHRSCCCSNKPDHQRTKNKIN